MRLPCRPHPLPVALQRNASDVLEVGYIADAKEKEECKASREKQTWGLHQFCCSATFLFNASFSWFCFSFCFVLFRLCFGCLCFAGQVHIPPPKLPGGKDGDDLVPITDLEQWAQLAFKGTKRLNPMQSKASQQRRSRLAVVKASSPDAQ